MREELATDIHFLINGLTKEMHITARKELQTRFVFKTFYVNLCFKNTIKKGESSIEF